MQLKDKDEKTLRAYLLGDLPPNEQEEIEQWLLCDEFAYDLLVAAEDDLIDDSLNGKLSSHELERLNSYFLASEERQRKWNFGRSLRQFIQSASRPQPTESFWESVSAFFRQRAPIAYAISAVVILLAIGNVWFMTRTVGLQKQIADAGQKREELGRQLDDRQAYLQTFEKAIAAAPDSQALMAVTLTSVNLRSPGDLKNISIAAGTLVVKLSLELLEDGNYDEYRAVLLRNRDDQDVWNSKGLGSTSGPDGRAVILAVPADVLSAGDYHVKLSGVANARPEDIGSFNFRVDRQ